ncbi:UNVERIFIED_CONTAM: 3-dehydroquinate synthase [Sesamum radiatum]|uniref:3-dehydroquinate synthase n=1 Tax=Sesamum radiatum TaxID=300843 RepID=A0AAW2P3Z5_SESRA
MAALSPSAPVLQFTFKGKSGSCRLAPFSLHDKKRTRFQYKPFFVKAMCACSSSSKSQKKQVWIWTEKKEVMTAAVERGWNTFIFQPDFRQLAAEWSSIALLSPLFIEDGGVFDGEHIKVANIFEISSPEELEKLQLLTEQIENVVVNLLDWQVIPAENIVAAIQGTQKTVFAISKTSSEAQIFLEALEQGLGGVVLKTGDVEAIFELKKNQDSQTSYSILLQNAETVALISSPGGRHQHTAIPVTSLKLGDEILLRVQGGARHTGIEIQEFIVEK